MFNNEISVLTVNSSQRSSGRSVLRAWGQGLRAWSLCQLRRTSSARSLPPSRVPSAALPLSPSPSLPTGAAAPSCLPVCAFSRSAQPLCSSRLLPLVVISFALLAGLYSFRASLAASPPLPSVRGAWARRHRGQFFSLLASAFVFGPLRSGFRARSSSYRRPRSRTLRPPSAGLPPLRPVVLLVPRRPPVACDSGRASDI